RRRLRRGLRGSERSRCFWTVGPPARAAPPPQLAQQAPRRFAMNPNLVVAAAFARETYKVAPDAGFATSPMTMMGLLALMALVPFAIMMLTSFSKIVVVLSLARSAMGSQQAPPTFVITELKEAFEIGFLIFLPFLVLDMVIANVLLALGMQTLSPSQVSLPFKILLFVAIDGWGLLARGLILGYR